MKWFKHDSTALHDAKIQKLIMKYGIAGYGLYFACVEIIAGNLSPTKITFELEHDSEILAHMFQMDTLKVEEIMKYCVKLDLFDLTPDNRIRCLKLAKRLDGTMSQHPEIQKIIGNGDFKKLIETSSNLKKLSAPLNPLQQTRLDKIRLEELEDSADSEAESTPSSGDTQPEDIAFTGKPVAVKKKRPPDPRIKILIDYYHDTFKRVRGFAPTVTGSWGKVFQILLRDSSETTIKAVVDEFFAYDKRTRHGIHDFERSYDNVYGRLYDQQHPGRQRHAT